jgi:RNA polymerase sigma-70 factor, ECF subfamily
MLPDLQPTTSALAFPFSGKAVDRIDHLFQRVRNDDYTAFEIIFKNSYRSLCSYSNQLVISPELAEEIVDDVFCSLWNNRKKINITSSFQSYLVISIRNRSLDCLRKQKGEKKYVLEKAERVQCKQSIASEKMIYEELCHQIDRAIQDLPEQCRLIFQMSREQELSYKEIAGMLNISIKTVDTQIGRALKFIRKSIASYDH